MGLRPSREIKKKTKQNTNNLRVNLFVPSFTEMGKHLFMPHDIRDKEKRV